MGVHVLCVFIYVHVMVESEHHNEAGHSEFVEIQSENFTCDQHIENANCKLMFRPPMTTVLNARQLVHKQYTPCVHQCVC